MNRYEDPEANKRFNLQMADHRAWWHRIAKERGWAHSPTMQYIQVWVTPDGEIIDSVSTRNMREDIILDASSDGETPTVV